VYNPRIQGQIIVIAKKLPARHSHIRGLLDQRACTINIFWSSRRL